MSAARAALIPGQQYISDVDRVGRSKGDVWLYLEAGSTEGLHHFTRGDERCVFSGDG